MKKKVMKSVDLVMLFQQETELGDAPKLITGQLRVPVPDELPCNKLAVFTETVGRKKHNKPYEHIVETEHWSLAQRKDMKFYMAQRKGFDIEEMKDPVAWKLSMMSEVNEVLDGVIGQFTVNN